MARPFRYLILTTLLAIPGLSFASPPQEAAAPTPAVKADVAASVNNLVKNPGMESGPQDWTTSDKAGQSVIRQGMGHGGSSFVMALGGANSDSSAAYQDVTIPVDATQVLVQFWYLVNSQEAAIESRPFDTATVVLSDPATNAVLANVASLTNANRTNGAWAQSTAVDVSAQKGKTVRLTFSSSTDGTRPTTFMFDDIVLAPVTTAPVTSFRAARVTGYPRTMRFTDQSQFATSWLWNFGDGATSTESNPTHQYPTRGSFTVTLTATNSSGSSSVTKTVRDFADITSIIQLLND